MDTDRQLKKNSLNRCHQLSVVLQWKCAPDQLMPQTSGKETVTIISGTHHQERVLSGRGPQHFHMLRILRRPTNVLNQVDLPMVEILTCHLTILECSFCLLKQRN